MADDEVADPSRLRAAVRWGLPWSTMRRSCSGTPEGAGLRQRANLVQSRARGPCAAARIPEGAGLRQRANPVQSRARGPRAVARMLASCRDDSCGRLGARFCLITASSESRRQGTRQPSRDSGPPGCPARWCTVPVGNRGCLAIDAPAAASSSPDRRPCLSMSTVTPDARVPRSRDMDECLAAHPPHRACSPPTSNRGVRCVVRPHNCF